MFNYYTPKAQANIKSEDVSKTNVFIDHAVAGICEPNKAFMSMFLDFILTVVDSAFPVALGGSDHYNLTNSRPTRLAGMAENKKIIVWGTNLESGTSKIKITQKLRDMYKIAPYQYSVIIGLLLSDG